MSRDITFVELTALFANHGLVAPSLDFTVSGRTRAGTTCQAEILAAINLLDGDGPLQWHSLDAVIAKVKSSAVGDRVTGDLNATSAIWRSHTTNHSAR